MTEERQITYRSEVLRKGIHLLSLSIPVVRASLVNDSDLRLAKFEESIRDNGSADNASREGDLKSHRAAYSLKRFIVRRHQHVQAQLEGKETGVVFRSRKRLDQK